MTENTCYELIQVAIGTRERLSRSLSDEEWSSMLAASRKQAIEGVMLVSIQHLPSLNCFGGWGKY